MSNEAVQEINRKIRIPIVPTLVLTVIGLVLSFMGMLPIWVVWLCLAANSFLSAFADHYWKDIVKKWLTEDEYNRFYPGGLKRRLTFRLVFGGLALVLAAFDFFV